MAILFPLALLLILAIVQAGLAWHARNVLAEAAQAGVDAGRVLHAAGDDAHAAATSFVNRAGARVVSAPSVSAHVGPDTVSVTVTGTAQKVLPIPGVEFRLTLGASAPAERWTGP